MVSILKSNLISCGKISQIKFCLKKHYIWDRIYIMEKLIFEYWVSCTVFGQGRNFIVNQRHYLSYIGLNMWTRYFFQIKLNKILFLCKILGSGWRKCVYHISVYSDFLRKCLLYFLNSLNSSWKPYISGAKIGII